VINVSIIIINYQGLQHTIQCIESIRTTQSGAQWEIIVVDNGSSDGSVEAIKAKYPAIKVLAQQQNLGFGKANNIGARESTGKYLFFVNNDTIFKEDIVTPLSRFLEENSTYGAVSPLLLNADGSYQHSTGYFPSLKNERRTQKDTNEIKSIPENRIPQEVDWVSFAAVMIPRLAFEQIGGFDERYFMYFEDADVCLRLKKAGWNTVYFPKSALVHLGGASWLPAQTSRIRYEYRRSQLLFYALHRSISEQILVRLYLVCKYVFVALRTSGEDRQGAITIIRLAMTYANRS
jgi:GT2 family glycosyltransferase